MYLYPPKNHVLTIITTLRTLRVADDLVLQKTIINFDVIYIIVSFINVSLTNIIIAILGLLLICNDYWIFNAGDFHCLNIIAIILLYLFDYQSI